jgi:hypothetical protein
MHHAVLIVKLASDVVQPYNSRLGVIRQKLKTMSNEQPQSEQLLAGHPQEENQIIAERRSKLAAMRKAGIAFPNDFERKHLASDLRDA